MKTQISQSTREFTPIDISIRLETSEELEQFLLLTSVMADSGCYAEELPNIDFGTGGACVLPDSKRLAQFMEILLTSRQWRDLATIYKTYQGS